MSFFWVFVVAPFCSCPCHWFLDFFCCRPRVCKVFFLVAPHWAPRPFGGARAKNTPHRVFFLCSGPGERQGKEKHRWAPARGFSFPCLSPGVFFCCGPAGSFKTRCSTPDIFCYWLAGFCGAAAKKKKHQGRAEIAPAHSE